MTQMAAEAPVEIIEAVGGMRRPVVVAHVVPDADALGSIFATALAYNGNGCAPKVALPAGSLSQRLAFMHDWAKVPVAGRTDFEKADGFIVLDTAKKERCNVGPDQRNTDWSAGRPVVNIDHHDTNTRFGDVNWVDAEASSSAELVLRLLQAAGRPVSPMVASMLYAGVLTDTAGFSLPTTSPSGLAAAAELVRLGADVAELGERLCRSQTQSEFDLLRIIYANTKRAAGGAIAYSTATYEDITGAGCTAADIDDQVSIPRSLDGVRLAMLLTEGNKGKTRINFRGDGRVEVLELAQKFNGGGHRQAAGAVIDTPLSDTVKMVVAAAVEHLKKY
ncbi:MAG: bifunctional oligoribonuclease/PAP phosphatase NrnA [Phycisphaerales bacterium]|nr:MAG: bifunctional oligoribonuclease/PAP phosphatase NrnA [Phycisphaerales bacterium]